MGKPNRFGGEASNRFKGLADAKTQPLRYLSFSFKDLDPSQGKTFVQWEQSGFLAQACERIQNYCQQRIPDCFSKSFKTYESWPKHSKYRRPPHVAEDAQWASMHIQGKQCLGGHLVGNVFYVVFLDEDHHLWPTSKKHT